MSTEADGEEEKDGHDDDTDKTWFEWYIPREEDQERGVFKTEVRVWQPNTHVWADSKSGSVPPSFSLEIQKHGRRFF